MSKKIKVTNLKETILHCLFNEQLLILGFIPFEQTFQFSNKPNKPLF